MKIYKFALYGYALLLGCWLSVCYIFPPEPSQMGNMLFWVIEGFFFVYLAIETRKYRKIKVG